MAERVVDVLEAVEIDHHHRDRAAMAGRIVEGAAKAEGEQRPVRQRRQVVVEGQHMEPPGRPPQVPDQPEQQHQDRQGGDGADRPEGGDEAVTGAVGHPGEVGERLARRGDDRHGAFGDRCAGEQHLRPGELVLVRDLADEARIEEADRHMEVLAARRLAQRVRIRDHGLDAHDRRATVEQDIVLDPEASGLVPVRDAVAAGGDRVAERQDQGLDGGLVLAVGSRRRDGAAVVHGVDGPVPVVQDIGPVMAEIGAHPFAEIVWPSRPGRRPSPGAPPRPR